jgi:hypothetical protein
MPPEESPEAKFDRLKKQLQDSILTDYPNPERKGCPDGAVLKELAGRTLDETIEDEPHWQHVTHCSECYRDFLALNVEFRRQAKARRVQVRWGTAVALAVILIAGVLFALRQGAFFTQRPQNAELAYAKQTVDIPSMSRSVDGGATNPIILERKPVELTIQLPVGSKAGEYEFQLRREGQPVVSASATAAIREGSTAFSVRLDLSKLAPGMYSMYVRQVPWDWNYYPVELRAN